jgi:hypothetical protein
MLLCNDAAAARAMASRRLRQQQQGPAFRRSSSCALLDHFLVGLRTGICTRILRPVHIQAHDQ